MIVVDRFLALLLALFFIVLGVIVPIEWLLWVLDKKPWFWLVPDDRWMGPLAENTWQTRSVRVLAVVLIIIGALLVLAELKRRRPKTLALESETEGVDVQVSRKSVNAALKRAALDVEGVTDVSSSLRRRKATITATTRRHQAADLPDRVRAAVEERNAALGLRKPLSVKVGVDTPKDR